ncbi:MAG: hypothetical protein JWM16_3113, partial [Verrucomicrobiales bacterium]|nr:hypothetical protein [Verrucomicrobiales bacterium]
MTMIKTLLGRHLSPGWLLVSLLFIPSLRVLGQPGKTVELPAGVQAIWDTAKADREATPTRERICVNGLWRWQPARAA